MRESRTDDTGESDPEKAPGENEERYRLMVEGSEHVFFYIHDLKHTVEYLSPSVHRVLGYQPEHYVGQPYEQMLTGDPSDELVAELTDSALRQGSGRSTYSMLARHADGHTVVLELIESPVERNGIVIGMRGFARDITERRRAEEALRESNQTVRALIEASPLAIVTVDLERRVKLWNPAAERLFGWTAGEVVGQVEPHVPETKHSDLEEIREKALRGDGFVSFETRRIRKDGRLVDVNLSASALRNGTGALSGLMGIYADTTERKRLEEQVRQSQKMEAIGQLAGGVAHDFNNILTVISAYSDMLRQSLGEDDDRRADVDEISKAADRAAGLTRQLLAFSRQQVIQPKVLDLNRVVTEVEKMLRRLLREDVQLTTVLAPGLGRVRADPGQLEQILMNLAVNARDAMPDGGTLTIETSNASARVMDGASPASVVLLTVRDTGTGMNAETKARLFEPFFTTKEVGTGTGLGLATVYGIVTQSGGSIDVTSSPGAGATFSIALPMVKGTTTPERPRRAGISLPRGTETILLVEDDEAVRRLVRYALEDNGYALLEAANGEEGLRVSKAYEHVIHLLVTDMVMPRMNGREVAERLAVARPAMRVLYMSGYAEEVTRSQGLPAGARLLQKPFTVDVIGRAVREVLDSQ
ncbi:MAG TPA: PAS domain S-box protein [Gemmatimonadaceae bacterium]|nr:PAS domain S-box protein [Gemmatimonadaceae bacterium]